MKTKHGCLIVEVLVLALTGVFLFLALNSTHPESSIIRDYIIAHGSEHTGALNLVTAIYLGYRAFDTLEKPLFSCLQSRELSILRILTERIRLMSKTTILDLASRKLAPFMLLFGFYLLTYGHISPGGGFQGGVVIASGVILLAISRGVEAAELLFPIKNLLKVEAFVFFLLLLVGVSGIIAV
jgi:multicomponent Na+:H+ antiporter subunit B